MPKTLNVALLVSLMMSIASTAAVDAIEPPRPSGAPTRTEWARPMAQGVPRVLFIAPHSAHQDTHELLERFDMDAEVVAVSEYRAHREFGMPSVYYPEQARTPEAIFAELRRAVRGDWQVLTMSAWPAWSAYPEDIRRAILERVVEGRTLLVAGSPTDANAEADAAAGGLVELPWDSDRFAPSPGEGGATRYRCGSGRLILLDHQGKPNEGYLLTDSPYQSAFERSAARAGALLRDAAFPDTKHELAATRFDGERLTVASAQHAADPDNLRLRLHVRRHDTYRSVFQKETAWGRDGAAVALPGLPAGDYVAELRLIGTGGGVHDWDSAVFHVDRPATLADVQASPAALAPGDEVEIAYTIEGAGEGTQLVARWYDQWDRLLIETDPMPADGALRLVAPETSLAALNHVELTLVHDGEPWSIARAPVTLQDAYRPTDFTVSYWNIGTRGSWRYRLYLEALRTTGMADALNNVAPDADAARWIASAKLRAVPYASYLRKATLDGHVFNPEWRAEQEARVRKAIDAYEPYDPLAYTLGDENYMNAFDPNGRFSNSSAVWPSFLAYLQERYDSLDALNRQWGTRFDTWEDIHFDNELDLLTDRDNPSAWFDYRGFVTRKYTELHRHLRGIILAADPGAAVGFDGAENFSAYDGIDWWELTRGMELVNLYSRYIHTGIYPNKAFNGEAVGSFAREARVRAAFLNTADADFGGTYDAWYLLLKGWNSVWWWHGSFIEQASGALAWDLQPTPIVDRMTEAARRIKQGPGTLLAHAQPVEPAIAVHYSANNWWASTLESGVGNHVNNLGHQQELWFAPSLIGRWFTPGNEVDDQVRLWRGVEPAGHYGPASKSAFMLLHDLGFQPRTLARQEIEAGALAESELRVLVLPFVVSLSDDEVQAIRAFVERGGLLIADYRCGVRDDRGRLRDGGGLDDAFGIERDGLAVDRRVMQTVADTDRAGARFESIFREPVRPASARPLGYHSDGTPAFLVNKLGEGVAIYLNSDLYAYDHLREIGQAGRLRELFRHLIGRHAGLHAPLIVKHELGHPVDAVEVTRHRDGDTTYHGIIPDYAVDDLSPKKTLLEFPPTSHLYDVGEQRYLGSGVIRGETLTPGRPRLIAELPYRVTGLELSAPARAVPGQPIDVEIRVVPQAGPHAVRVRVHGPDGEALEHLEQTVYLPQGAGTLRLHPALNAPPGTWTLHAKDAVSGMEARHTMDLVRRPASP